MDINNIDELIDNLKLQIIQALSLDDLHPEDIDADTPLFGDGLGLDSIDAIELVLLLKREYGIVLEDPRKRREVLVNLRTMAQFIQSQLKDK